MSRALLGLVKGLLIGGVVSGALIRLGGQSVILAYLGCTLVGLLVGLLCGRLPWRAETIWTPVVKMLVGVILGAGLCYLSRRFLGGIDVPAGVVPGPVQALLAPKDTKLTLHAAELAAPVIGVLYGVFVEVDDGTSKDERPRAQR